MGVGTGLRSEIAVAKTVGDAKGVGEGTAVAFWTGGEVAVGKVVGAGVKIDVGLSLRARFSGPHSMSCKPASRMPRSRTEYTFVKARNQGCPPIFFRIQSEVGVPMAWDFRIGQRLPGATPIFALEPRPYTCYLEFMLGRLGDRRNSV